MMGGDALIFKQQHDALEDRYLFHVHKNIQREIQKRALDENSTKKNKKNTLATYQKVSDIGMSTVPTTLTKDNARKIVNTLEACYNEILPVKPKEKPKEKEKKRKVDNLTDLLENLFKDDEPITKKPKTKDLMESNELRHKMTNKLSKELDNFNIKTAQNVHKNVVNPKIKEYYDKIQGYSEYGNVGLLPLCFKNEKNFPQDFHTFTLSQEFKFLINFCKTMKIK